MSMAWNPLFLSSSFRWYTWWLLSSPRAVDDSSPLPPMPLPNDYPAKYYILPLSPPAVAIPLSPPSRYCSHDAHYSQPKQQQCYQTSPNWPPSPPTPKRARCLRQR